MALIPDRFTHVYVIDFEYQARDGEQQVPVAMVAKGFKKARDIRMFFDKPQPCPFTSDPETTLFIGFNIPSEYKCFLAQGWQLPKHTIDLYVEYRNLTCGVWRGKQSLWELGTGLVDVAKEYEGNPADFWKSDKHMMQRYISHYGVNAPAGAVETMQNEDGNEMFKDFDGEIHVLDRANPEHIKWYCTGRTQEEHAKMILDYCEEDVVATHFAAQHIMSESAFNFEQALHRGSYTRAVAHFEHHGLPINKERFEAIRANARSLQLHIVQEIERVHNYGVYVIEGREDLKNKPHPVFKMDKFVELLERNGIALGKTWQTTPTGKPVLDDDYFGDMCNAYPFLQPLRQCRKTLKTLSLFDTVIGEDGFQRFTLFMFGSVTSRNNPRATEFMLSRPHWMRNLLTPRPGYALVTADITGAEDWLAAGYSGDPELMRIYSSGADSYIEFAGVTGAVPAGTKRDKSNRELENIRAQHKTAKLAIQYGVQALTLAKYLGVPVWKAGQILNSHREAYNVYWQWVDDQAVKAKQRGYVITDYGWRQDVRRMNERSIMNFPQQAGCAELLRLACCFLVDDGWGFALSAPHHDAVYCHCPAGEAERLAHDIERAFIEAGKMLMDSDQDPTFKDRFPLRIKAHVVYHPDHYVDDDGAEIWKIVCEYFGWEGYEQSVEIAPQPVLTELEVANVAYSS